MEFYSKSKNLFLLQKLIKKGIILDQISFGIFEFENKHELITKLLIKKGWDKIDVIVRSSAYNEDRLKSSLAGRYLSLQARGLDEITDAINKVIASMEDNNINDEIFIQPYIANIKFNGVAFGMDPKTNGNYIVIEMNNSVDTNMFVTSGNNLNNQLFYFYDGLKNTIKIKNKLLHLIIDLMHELESIFNTKKIDIEFIIDTNESIYLLQVRPLIIPIKEKIDMNDTHKKIIKTFKSINMLFSKEADLHGSSNILGAMPDWNPAEVIGFKPNKLAYSLYNKLILERVWDIGRANYGYNEVKDKKLMLNILGGVYIDVRKSFNSLIPQGLPHGVAEKVIDCYLEKLKKDPLLHDKIEFEIVHSCYTFDNNFEDLSDAGISQEDIFTYANTLFSLTNNIISSDLIYKDFKKSRKLKKLHKQIMNTSHYSLVEKAKSLLYSCIEYGTIPFSGVARAAFIAEDFLRSFIRIGIFTKDDYHAFKEGNKCITSKILFDLNHIKQSAFLKKYGHLRPGTYDITQKRYDECPIFNITVMDEKKIKSNHRYKFSIDQIRKIQDCIILNHFNFNADKLISFISDAIRYRESIKFEFTKSISEILNIIKIIANDNGYTVEDISNCSIDSLLDPNTYVNNNLRQLIEFGKQEYNCTKSIVLPELIFSPEEIILFRMLNSDGNYVTNEKAEGETLEIKSIDNHINLDGKIIFIEQADPGFDWIFFYKIRGFITKYGGANSHMAIRANELSIPAIIGVGEQNYNILRSYNRIEINCLQRKVRGK